MQEKRKWIVVGEIAIWILIVLFLFLGMRRVGLSFDSAMNYQISENLAESGQYRSNYTEMNYQEAMFYHPVQTGAPVIMPAALLNLMFGSSPVNMQIVTTLYLLALFILVKIVVEKFAGIILAFLAVLYLTVFPDITILAWQSLGEVAMGVWMLLAFIIYQNGRKKKSKWSYFILGVIAGIGFLTKTAYLICVPSFILFILYDLYKSKGKILIEYGKTCIGFLIPVGGFELYKFLCLGKEEYIEWWGYERGAIFQQTGLGQHVEISLLNKISQRFVILADLANMQWYWLALIIVVPAVWFAWIYFIKRGRSSFLLQCYIMFMGYTAWWCLYLPETKLWLRRVEVGLILGIIVFFSVVGLCIKDIVHDFKERKKIKSACVRSVGGGIIFCCLLVNFIGNTIDFEQYYKYMVSIQNSVEAVSEYIDSLPEDSVFMGVAWWQAPVIAAESNVEILNLEYYDNVIDEFYFVEDSYMKSGEANGIKNRLGSRYAVETVYEGGRDTVYKVSRLSETEIVEMGNYIRFEFEETYKGSSSLYIDNGEGFSENIRYFSWNNDSKTFLWNIEETEVMSCRFMIDGKYDSLKIKSIEYCQNGTLHKWSGEELQNIVTCVGYMQSEKDGVILTRTSGTFYFEVHMNVEA